MIFEKYVESNSKVQLNLSPIRHGSSPWPNVQKRRTAAGSNKKNKLSFHVGTTGKFLLEVICQKKANWTHIFEGHFLKLRIWRLPKLKIPKDVFLTKMKPKTVEHVAPEF